MVYGEMVYGVKQDQVERVKCVRNDAGGQIKRTYLFDFDYNIYIYMDVNIF